MALRGRAAGAAASSSGPSDTPSSSGSDSDSDSEGGGSGDALTEGEIAFLERVQCAACSKPLLPKPPRWGRGGGPAAARPDPADYLVCDGCRRCFHERCCEERGMDINAAADGTWFHDAGCKRVLEALAAQAARGPAALPGDRSWQLVALGSGAAAAARQQQQQQKQQEEAAPEKRKGGWLGGRGGGKGADKSGGDGGVAARKQQLISLVEVLAPEYGPGVADRLLDGGAGYALLLTRGGEPLTAATLDVYGTDLATIDLFTTSIAERGRGHGTALLRAAEAFLGSKARVKRLVAVTSSPDKVGAGVMQRKFRFARINAREARLLGAQFPALQYYEQSVMLSKDLTSAARAAQLKAATAGKAPKHGEQGQGAAAAGEAEAGAGAGAEAAAGADGQPREAAGAGASKK